MHRSLPQSSSSSSFPPSFGGVSHPVELDTLDMVLNEIKLVGSEKKQPRYDKGNLKLEGHTHNVSAAVFSPDGTRLASCSYDKTVRIWDAATGEALHTLEGHMGLIVSVAFSSDGTRLASCSGDKAVRIWDAETGEELHTLRGHLDSVWAVVFSPDGTRLASCSWDHTVRMWDTETGEELHTLEGHIDEVLSVVFSPDGTRLASCAHDCTVRIWDAETGAALHKLAGHTNIVSSAMYSPDGTRLASCSYDKTVRIWDAATGEALHTLEGHMDSVNSVAFSPDSTRLASCSKDNFVRVWDVEAGEALHSLEGHMGELRSVVFSPDGVRLASCSKDTTVCIWDAETGEALATFKDHTDAIDSVVFSPDGTRTASCSWDKTVRIWDVATGAALRSLEGHSSEVNVVVLSPDGTRLASCSPDKTVRIWDAETGAALHTLEGHTDDVPSVLFSPDGTCIASCSRDNTVRIWDTETGAALHTLEGHTDGVFSVLFSPDGTCIASCSRDKTVRIWNAETGELLHALEGHTKAVYSVALSPDGTRLASCAGDNTVRIWDVETGEALHTLEGHSDSGWTVAFSPDGTRLASGSWDNTVRIWDVGTGKALHTLDDHTADVLSVLFSPDGAHLVSCSGDNTVRIWNTETGRAVRVLEDHTDDVVSVLFSPDGTHLASCSGDSTVRIWDADTGEALQSLDGHTGEVNSVVFFPDGTRLASGSSDSTVRIWQLGQCPTFEELALKCVLHASVLEACLRRFPLAVQRRASGDGDDYMAGETIVHVLARRGDAARLRVVLASSEHACPLQTGPRGSPLLAAVRARNDECVSVLLDAIVQQCNSDDGSSAWRFHSGALADAIPLLAESYGADITATLNRMQLPVVPESLLYASKNCSNIKPMRLDEAFHTSARHLRSKDVWHRYFERGQDVEQEALVQRVQRGLGASGRVPGSVGTDVAATVVPVEGLAGSQHVASKKTLQQHPIGALVAAGLADALGSPVINHVLTFKWNRYARDVFLASMRLYMVMLALFTLATVQDECYDVADGDGWWAWVRVANDIAVVLLAVHHLRLEVRQVRKEGVLPYLGSIWNVLDVVGLLLILVLVPFRIFCWEHASTLQSVAAVCLWLKLLDFFRAFRTTGPFVRMVFRIVNAVGFFLLVLTVVLVAFSHGLFLIFRGVDEVAASESGTAFDFGSWWVLVKMYQVMVSGEFDRTELTLASSEGLALAYVVTFSAFATILMLNLLIALMGSVYAEVEANVENEWLLERAQIVLDIDQYMSESELANEEWFPRWVHVLRAKNAKAVERQATNNEVEERVKAEVLQVREEVKQVEAKVGKVETKVDKLAERVDAVLQLLQAMHGDGAADEAKRDSDEESE